MQSSKNIICSLDWVVRAKNDGRKKVIKSFVNQVVLLKSVDRQVLLIIYILDQVTPLQL